MQNLAGAATQPLRCYETEFLRMPLRSVRLMWISGRVDPAKNYDRMDVINSYGKGETIYGYRESGRMKKDG